MEFLRALNEELTYKQLQSPNKLPTLADLKSYLEKQFGQVKVKGGRTTIVVVLPKFDEPEIVEDRANRALRAFGLDYTDLSPGKPKETGMTRQFTIYGPEIDPAHYQEREQELQQKRERKKKLNDLLDLDQDRLRRPKYASV